MTITTGLKSLDNLLIHPLRRGTITLYAGATSSGMTTLLDTAVVGTAVTNKVPTVLCDLETPEYAHMYRLIAAVSGVPLEGLQRNTLKGIDQARSVATTFEIKSAPLVQSSARTIEGLRDDLVKSNAQLVAVDGARFLNYTDEVPSEHDARVLADLKSMARDLNVAVLVTVPLKRQQSGRLPCLADVPSEFEQMADAIVLLARDESAGRAQASLTASVDLMVVKNRNGGCGEVETVGQYTHARFRDLGDTGKRAA